MSDEKSSKARPDEHSSSSAQQALSDYFDLMLGGLDESPLSSLADSNIDEPDKEFNLTPPVLEAGTSSDPIGRKDDSPPVTNIPDKDDSSSLSVPPPIPDSGVSYAAALRSGKESSSHSSSVIKTATERDLSSEQARPVAPPSELSMPKLAPPKLAPAPLVKSKVQPVIETSTQTKERQQGKVSDKERLAIKEMLRQQRADKEARLQEALAARNLTVADAIAKRAQSTESGIVARKSNGKVESQSTQEASKTGFVPPAWPSNGRPLWAQDRFECLLFTVAGLKLAVPLVSLGSIHRLDSELTPLVGRAKWFLGLYRYGDRNIRVVDTAQWVMPKLHHAGVIDAYEFVIRLGEGNWGVACDCVHEAIQLEPDQVKWRTQRSKRAWLSGTVIEHMCALLDADALGGMLDFEVAQRVR